MDPKKFSSWILADGLKIEVVPLLARLDCQLHDRDLRDRRRSGVVFGAGADDQTAVPRWTDVNAAIGTVPSVPLVVSLCRS